MAGARPECIGVLLAGGESRRFGGLPKGLAIVDEMRIADRAIAALRAASDDVIVVANDPDAQSWFPTMRVVADAVPGLGPLAGIETALRAANGAAVLVVAWDMPFVPAPLLRGMRALGDTGAEAVAPVHDDPPMIESLCAYYAASALPACSELLARGERRAWSLFAQLPSALAVPERVLVEHGVPERIFFSVDEPEELEELGGELPRR
ncbi:MAG TPA: molybdenum cofactor guanylyltransferase [Gemmatimonadaceae bacterium]